MPCLIVLLAVIAIMAGVVAHWAWKLRSGDITLRWWAIPVLAASVLASVLGILLPLLFGMIFGSGDTMPAPWLQNAWTSWVWLLAFAWIAGMIVVVGLEGMTFANPRVRTRTLATFVAVMAPLSLAEVAVILLPTRIEKTVEIAVATSPDGRLRVHAFECFGWDGSVHYTLVGERNTWLPLLATRLVDRGFLGETSSERSAALVWSKDSQMVALWSRGWPLMAYACPKAGDKEFLTGTWAWHVLPYDDSVEFENRYNRHMADHGGPSP
jgi:hypothetical protein